MGRRCPDAGAETFPLRPVMKTIGEAGCHPAVRGGPRWSRYPPAAHGRPHAGADICLKEDVTPWEAHAGGGSCQDLWTHGERSPC